MTEIRPIRTERDYQDALRNVSELWGSAAGTPEGDRLDVLATLIDAYEKEHFSIDAPSDEALAAFEQEQKNALAEPAAGELVFNILEDAAGRFAFTLTERSGEVILRSESFGSKADAINAIKLLQASASQSKIVDVAA